LIVPEHECLEIAVGPAVDNALEVQGEPDLRIDVVHLRRLKERGDRRPGPSATIAASEESDSTQCERRTPVKLGNITPSELAMKMALEKRAA